jgi:hypothetical protein
MKNLSQPLVTGLVGDALRLPVWSPLHPRSFLIHSGMDQCRHNGGRRAGQLRQLLLVHQDRLLPLSVRDRFNRPIVAGGDLVAGTDVG